MAFEIWPLSAKKTTIIIIMILSFFSFFLLISLLTYTRVSQTFLDFSKVHFEGQAASYKANEWFPRKELSLKFFGGAIRGNLHTWPILRDMSCHFLSLGVVLWRTPKKHKSSGETRPDPQNPLNMSRADDDIICSIFISIHARLHRSPLSCFSS